MVLGRVHLESRLIPDCFHGHFCLGAGVVDPQHGDCQQPSVPPSIRISLSRIDKGFCLILDDLEKNYYESGKNSETRQQGRERRLNGRIRMLVCTKNAVIEGIKPNRVLRILRLDCVESHRPKRARMQKDRFALASL